MGVEGEVYEGTQVKKIIGVYKVEKGQRGRVRWGWERWKRKEGEWEGMGKGKSVKRAEEREEGGEG